MPVSRKLGKNGNFYSKSDYLISFSKSAIRILLIFGVKLGLYEGFKLAETNFSKKCRFPGNWAKPGNFYSKSDYLISFSKSALRILLIFGVKLGLYKGFKLAETNFLKKCCFPGNWAKTGNFYSKSDSLIFFSPNFLKGFF